MPQSSRLSTKDAHAAHMRAGKPRKKYERRKLVLDAEPKVNPRFPPLAPVGFYGAIRYGGFASIPLLRCELL